VPGGSPAITAAVFRAVRTGNAFEETVERLLEGVKLGVYAPGDRLPPERELTRRLGVSRITLREALHELGAAGYVETKRGRFGGTFVIRQPEPMVPDELTRTARELGRGLDDALTFRRVVETGAAEMAARASLSRQQRENLAECLASIQDSGTSGYRQADTRLHLAIADAAGSALLTASVVEARVRLVDLLNAIPMLERNLEHANVQHASIVRAILAGDPERARRAMEEHVAGTAALLRGFLGETALSRRDDPQTPRTGGRPGPPYPARRPLDSSLAWWVNTFIQWISSSHIWPFAHVFTSIYDTPYVLSGSIWTSDVGRAIRVARAVESGNLSVNSHSSVRYWTPFGGFKQSGHGRELGPDAPDAFTETKNVFISTEE
jgi:GntR family transcriptional regulator, transcriptional repressor for pyruvate dehydrogenase complex